MPTFEAMLLSCIDPRMVAPVHEYMARRGLSGKYSQFTIAGAAIGVVAPQFRDWHRAFWDNLSASIQLHRIRSLIVIDHRDCGGARIAFGPEAIATPETETATHQRILAQFRQEVLRRHPDLTVEAGLMALDGQLEMLA